MWLSVILGGLTTLSYLVVGLASVGFFWGVVTGLISDDWSYLKISLWVGLCAFAVQIIGQILSHLFMKIMEGQISEKENTR